MNMKTGVMTTCNPVKVQTHLKGAVIDWSGATVEWWLAGGNRWRLGESILYWHLLASEIKLAFGSTVGAVWCGVEVGHVVGICCSGNCYWKRTVFWVEDQRRFASKYCLYLHGRRVSQANSKQTRSVCYIEASEDKGEVIINNVLGAVEV
jgi:hypothetical protein